MTSSDSIDFAVLAPDLTRPRARVLSNVLRRDKRSTVLCPSPRPI